MRVYSCAVSHLQQSEKSLRALEDTVRGSHLVWINTELANGELKKNNTNTNTALLLCPRYLEEWLSTVRILGIAMVLAPHDLFKQQHLTIALKLGCE